MLFFGRSYSLRFLSFESNVGVVLMHGLDTVNWSRASGRRFIARASRSWSRLHWIPSEQAVSLNGSFPK